MDAQELTGVELRLDARRCGPYQVICRADMEANVISVSLPPIDVVRPHDSKDPIDLDGDAVEEFPTSRLLRVLLQIIA